ncbi:hypothetical protein LUX32_47500 [Actinomadura madurae]|nr:hypothetical protein [Actinomadura madurae]
MRYRGSLIKVAVTAESASYELLDGPGITLWHHGEEFSLSDDEPGGAADRADPGASGAAQPSGREPAPRRIDPHGRVPLRR